MKEVKYRNIRIEEQLLEDIEGLGLTNGKDGTKMKALHFIAILLEKSHKKMGSKCDYHPIPSEFLIKTFSNRYSKFLEPLRDSGIVQVKYIASQWDGRCNVYGLNPKYFKGETELRNLKVRYKLDVNKDLSQDIREATADFKKFYDLLVINEKKLFQRLYNKVDAIDREVYPLNENVNALPQAQIKYSNGYRTSHTYVYNLLDKAKKSDKNLIQDGKDFYFMKVDEYKALKKYHINSSWTSSIKDLVEGNLRVTKDKKGKREHTNLTNLPTELREIIFEDSGISNQDISNSQFAFYSMLALKKGITNLDALKFFKNCQNGSIYELVQEALKLESRGKAKQTMFLINFSSDLYESDLKNGFKDKFPSIAADISDYKQRYGSEAFPLLLQQTEASYILDKVRPKLKKMGIITASIHDSVCSLNEDSATVIEVMKEIAQEIGLKAQIQEEKQLKVA